MYELTLLREHIEARDYQSALTVVGELEEMGRDARISNIKSYAVVLLLHIIKQHAEGRTTGSWEQSIYNATVGIQDLNERRKSRGVYIKREEMAEIVQSAYPRALKNASFEAFWGEKEPRELAEMIDRAKIEAEALRLIWDESDNG